MSLIVKNGTIVTAADVYKADIEMKDGIISQIAPSIEPADGDKVIDAAGQYVFPGGIDPHVHFEHPDYVDNFADGSRAAAAGGITTVQSYAEPPLKGMTLLENYKMWLEKAKHSYIDYVITPIVTEDHLDDFLDNVDALNEAGVYSIKLFMSARGIGLLVSDDGLYKILKKCGEKYMIATVHCENGDVIDDIVKENIAKGNISPLYHGLSRPTYLEAEATNRILAIAEAAGASVRVAHISCKEAADMLAKYEAKGLHVFGETCAHYLHKDITDLDKDFEYSARYICSPPLREKWNQEALWEALRDGTITTMGSDHAPVAFKGMPVSRVNAIIDGKVYFNKIPNGGAGVEDMFSVMYSSGVAEGRLTLQQFAAVISTNAAKQLGMYPKKGTIVAGGDGDLVVLDPNKSRTISQKTQYQKADYNGYEGMVVKGVITHVISRGEEIVCNGKFDAKEDRGQMIMRDGIRF
jgi:dihydropyrimidinase